MKEFAALRAKIYSYLTDSNDECKKTKDRKVFKKMNLKIIKIV